MGAPLRTVVPGVRLDPRDGAARIFLSEHLGDATPDSLVYLRVPDVDALAATLGVERRRAAVGAQIYLTDPDGNRLRIGTPRAD